MEDLKGNKFVEEVVDYAQKYQQHLSGPNSHIPFSPTSGTIPRLCSTCFYRDWEGAPDHDCHCGEKGDEAKIAFKIPSNEFMPQQIDGKEVGHYCPHWTDFDAE